MVCLVSKERWELFRPLIPAELHSQMEEENVFLVGAIEENKAVGAAVLELGELTLELLSVVVAPAWRRRGVGASILLRCTALAQEISVRAFEVAAPSSMTELEGFFSSLPWLRCEPASSYVEVQVGDLKKIPLLAGGAPNAIPLEQVPILAYRDYLRKTFPEDPTQCLRQDLDLRVSQAIVKNGEIRACALVMPSEDGVSLSWLHNTSSDKLAVLILLRAAVAAVCTYYPEDASIQFSVDSEQLESFSEKLLAGVGRREQMNVWAIEDVDLMLFEEEQFSSSEAPRP